MCCLYIKGLKEFEPELLSNKHAHSCTSTGTVYGENGYTLPVKHHFLVLIENGKKRQVNLMGTVWEKYSNRIVYLQARCYFLYEYSYLSTDIVLHDEGKNSLMHRLINRIENVKLIIKDMH